MKIRDPLSRVKQQDCRNLGGRGSGSPEFGNDNLLLQKALLIIRLSYGSKQDAIKFFQAPLPTKFLNHLTALNKMRENPLREKRKKFLMG
jgi:hypothetical protein